MEQPNLSYIKSMSGGDEGFEQKLIGIIKSEFPVEKETYVNAVAEQNHKATAEIVHKLKHKISILGLVKSYDVAVEYEHNLTEGSTEGQENFEAILKRITEYLETL